MDRKEKWTLREQIDKFYKETGCRLKIKDGKPYWNGSLYLAFLEDLTELPDNLVVGGYLDLRNTKITKLPDNLVVGCNLELYNTRITELPNNLVVGGYLDLRGTEITELPENLVVGDDLDLDKTDIKKLPDNLVVGGNLYLYDTKITELPDNLVVGGYLDLSYTKISKLPENLVAGGRIYGIPNNSVTHTLTKEAKEKLQEIKNFLQWEQGGKTYVKADGIFSVVDSHKGNVWITHRVGKDETLYIVTDGEGHYAHGDSLKEAKTDLIYKINNRDTSLYENLSLDDEISFEEAIAMYRIITGACSAGTRDFVKNRLPQPHKEKYMIREIIELTDGEYGNEKLKEFFQNK